MMMWIIYAQSKEVIRVVVLVVNLYSMTRSCRTYDFQDQPGYWYPSNSEMRANKIKQVPGDLKLRTDKDKTRKQGARSLSSELTKTNQTRKQGTPTDIAIK